MQIVTLLANATLDGHSYKSLPPEEEVHYEAILLMEPEMGLSLSGAEALNPSALCQW